VYVIVSCSILKEPYIRQFGRFNDVYGQSLSFVLEHAIFYVDNQCPNEQGRISAIVERRGKREDKNLMNYYQQLLDKGTYWVTAERMKSRHEPDNSSDRGHPNPSKWNTSIVLCAKIGIFLLSSKLLSSEFKEKCIFPLMSREKVQLRLNIFPLFSILTLKIQILFVPLQLVRGEIRTNDALFIETHLTELA
jgi:hypothetical protein